MQIIIPATLRQYTEGKSKLSVDAQSVGTALDTAFQQYPALQTSLIDDAGCLRSHINLFVNSQNIRDLDGNATSVNQRDELLILGALAGG